MANIEIGRYEAELLTSALSLKIRAVTTGGSKAGDPLLAALMTLMRKTQEIATELNEQEEAVLERNRQQVRPMLTAPGVGKPLRGR